MNFLNDVQFNKVQLLQAVLENLATYPSSPVVGQVFFHTGDDTAYVRRAASWEDLLAGGALTDGDYGDVTVSSTGTVITIDPDSVTYAKMQNVVADNVLLGNIAGAGGVITELSAAQVRTLLNVEDGADVTDSANVAAAGATMDSDTDLSGASWFLNDGTMAANDPNKATSQASVVTYVATEISTALASAMIFKDGYNAGTNTPDLDSTPIATKVGDTYVVAGAGGTFFTEDVSIGDTLICKTDNATTLADWVIVEKNIPDIVAASESAAGVIELATQAEVNTGTDTERAVTPATLKSHLGVTASLHTPLTATEQIGNGAATSIAVTHNIGRQFLNIQVYQTASPYEQVWPKIEATSTTQTTFKFKTAPASNEYTVVITG